MSIRTLLLLDAATCFATGLLLLVATGLVSNLTGLPPVLLVAGGAILMPIALLMALLARHASPPVPGVVAIVALNLAWVVGCLAAIAFAGPTLLGVAFLAVQALAVTGFAWAEWRVGIGRRSSPV